MDTDNADFELVSESDSRCGLVPPGAKRKENPKQCYRKKEQQSHTEMGRPKEKVWLKTKLRRN